MPISSISITGVRGIRYEVKLNLNGRSLLLHGDNGTGKSSIERGLRWALLGQEEPSPDAAWDTEEGSRRNMLVKAADPSVKIDFTDGGSIEVRPGVCITNEQGAAHRNACQRGMPFLRRAELLDVLTSRPVDRFQYFESFLGLDKVDLLLKQLAEERAALERRRTDLTTRVTNNLQTFTPFLPTERQPLAISLAALEEEAVRCVSVALGISPGDWDEAKAAIGSAASMLADATLDQRRSSIKNAIHELTSLRDDLAKQQQWSQEDDNVIVTFESISAQTSQLHLLNHALAHFRRAEGTTCPVCGKNIDWTATRNELEERRRALAEYADSISRRDAVLDSWIHITARAEEIRKRSYLSHGAPCPEAAPQVVAITDGVSAIREAQRLAVRAVGTSELNRLLAVVLEEANRAAERAKSLLPGQESEPAVRTAHALITKLDPMRPQVRLLISESEQLKVEVEHLSLVHDALRRARQDVAKRILTAIGGQVAAYYFHIHPREQPDEATGAPSIEIQRHGRGTAFVRGQFKDQAVKDPRWVYSDGHLDTVGICVFLALRRMRADEKGDSKLLVLDDIVLSIDLGHARRLIDLLKSSFSDHQVLLFTHNGLFAYWCTHLFENMQRRRINSWTLENGPAIGDYTTAATRLASAVSKGGPKEIAMQVMALMDEWTADARYAYVLAVPARFDEQYTLADVWAPLVKKLKTLARELSSDLGGTLAILERLKDLPAMRNALAAHENEFAREFPRQVVVDAALDVLKLTSTLQCPDCGTFTAPPTGVAGVLTCKCGKRVFLREGTQPITN